MATSASASASASGKLLRACQLCSSSAPHHLNTSVPPHHLFPQHVGLPPAPIPFCGSAKRKFLQVTTYPRAGVIFAPLRASSERDGSAAQAEQEDGDGVSLGTMKLPPNTDTARFEDLLFQWANSLCQGANVPLPVPLKVDRVKGGARLGFIEVDDGGTRVDVYIDCVVSPTGAGDDSGPVFRAIRNGPARDRVPPGEPRIMRSLLQALQKAIEIAKV